MSEHDHSQLGAYALGALEPDGVREVDEHLAGCAECRAELVELEEMKEFLGEVPPEAFLDGPPTDGDLLLQRTLRQVRSESAPSPVVAATPGAPKKPARWLAVAAARSRDRRCCRWRRTDRAADGRHPGGGRYHPRGVQAGDGDRREHRYDDGSHCRTTGGLELDHRQHRGSQGRSPVPDVGHRQVRQDVCRW
ncbi:hypothetical protein F1D05_06340 [Kribbella qitaiheensis]|uniref:Putative zinc-finger domain-containing protein n=1 Tax=Kribbella qitaiheensis TaxID=1544730 RepID=A0A7G6WUD0_9ACTN|nr:hypothetical protein F1D05_06340 [Kribbella qitaiheensis]